MIKRVYPIFISTLGTLGLAVALAYLAGAYLAFQPGWEAWAEFFVPRSVYFIVIPYALLLSHLYFRTHLGAWFLRRGWVDEAIAYCEPRLSHHLMRSRAEALAHRVALARARVMRGDYAGARALLDADDSRPRRGHARLGIARWRMEVALREENLVRAHRAFDEVAGQHRPLKARRALDVCRAELAVREGDRQSYESAMARVKWKGQPSPRAQWVEVMATLRFSPAQASDAKGGDSSDEAAAISLATLDRIRDAICILLPFAQGELLAMRAELLYRSARLDEARQQLASLDAACCDARSHYEAERVRALIETQS